MNLSILLDSFLFTACAAAVIYSRSSSYFFFALSTEMLFNRKVLFLVLETTQKKNKVEVIYADRNLSSFAVLMK